VYLLYLDESGNESDPADKFFVLGGAAVFERTTFFLSQSLEAVQTKHFPGVPPLEFHASPIRTGKGFWRNVPEAKRLEVLEDIADVIANANDPGVSLFAAAIEKSSALYGEDAVLHATVRFCLGLISSWPNVRIRGTNSAVWLFSLKADLISGQRFGFESFGNSVPVGEFSEILATSHTLQALKSLDCCKSLISLLTPFSRCMSAANRTLPGGATAKRSTTSARMAGGWRSR